MLVQNYLPIINYLLPDKIFRLFKFNSLFRYKEYLFYFYISKLYLSFNRILKSRNLVVINSLLPKETFISKFSLDFIKLFDLSYNTFSNSDYLPFSNLAYIQKKRSSFLIVNSSYDIHRVKLSVPFGYLRD